MLLAAMLMNFTAFMPTATASAYQLDSGKGRSCSSRDQREVLDSIPECRVRETLVDLRPYFANRSDVVEVIPSHAVLKRCGGGCALPPHSCQAARGGRQTTRRTVEVMLVLGIWPHGEHEVVCSRLQLEEDRECECECGVREHHCRAGHQYYDPSSCR
jgi:hypothetical protein